MTAGRETTVHAISGLVTGEDPTENLVGHQGRVRANHRIALAAPGVDRTAIAIGHPAAGMATNAAVPIAKVIVRDRSINRCRRSP